MLEIASRSDADAQLWVALREVCDLFSELPWVLVGGLTVRLLEAEHERETPVATVDIVDVLDVRRTRTEGRHRDGPASVHLPDRRRVTSATWSSAIGGIGRRHAVRSPGPRPRRSDHHQGEGRDERGYVRRNRGLTDPGHAAWSLVADAERGSQNPSIIGG